MFGALQQHCSGTVGLHALKAGVEVVLWRSYMWE